MLELAPRSAYVLSCLAEPAALDALEAPRGMIGCRVASDETTLVGETHATALVVEAVTADVRTLDPDAVVIDATEGWAVWRLSGDEARAAFARLSRLELPRHGFVGGAVCGLPVRVLSTPEAIDLIVQSMWSHHLRAKVLERCADLGLEQEVR